MQALRAYVARLEQQLAAARAEAAATAARTAEPAAPTTPPAPERLAFPSNLPETHAPRAFERIATDAAKSCGMALEVVSVDCSEYPCIAWTRAMDDKVQMFSMNDCAPWASAFPEGTSVFGAFGDAEDGGQERYMGWMAMPADKSLRGPAMQRAMVRFKELKEALHLR